MPVWLGLRLAGPPQERAAPWLMVIPAEAMAMELKPDGQQERVDHGQEPTLTNVDWCGQIIVITAAHVPTCQARPHGHSNAPMQRSHTEGQSGTEAATHVKANHTG